MFSFRSLLLLHGYVFLFTYVFGVQAGIPIPADPLLLIMGALTADRYYSLPVALLVTCAGALAGDLLWYEIGRRRGRSVLALLCKLSLEPDYCVQKTEGRFGKRGAWTLLFTKFIPGMSLVSTPLAGAIRMPRWRFLLSDAGGCLLWASSYLLLGRILHRQVDLVIIWLGLVGSRAGLIALTLGALYIAFKYFQRWRFRRELRMNRISPEEALALLDSGIGVTVVDLRRRSEVEEFNLKIAGAMVLAPEDLRSRAHEIPKEHEIILYCS